MPLWKTKDDDEFKPAHLTAAEKTNVFGIDVNEAIANRDKGINTPGWVKHVSYTNESGVVRQKTEVLVAARSMSTDTDDDDFQNFAIKLKKLVKTLDVPVLGSGVNLKVEASTNPVTTGVTFTYDWQELNVDTWESISGATSDTLTLVWNAGDEGTTKQVRCVVGDSAEETEAVTSSVCQVTFATEYTLTVVDLPATLAVDANDADVLEVEATIAPTEGAPTITYQWQEKVSGEWVDISNTTTAYEATWTEDLAEVEVEVRCVVSAGDDVVVVESTSTTITYAAAPVTP